MCALFGQNEALCAIFCCNIFGEKAEGLKNKESLLGAKGQSMKRKLVSQDELLKVMNSELAKHDQCTDCHFTSILALREVDEDGCNWSSMVNLRCSGVPSDICWPIANRISAKAREKFNLK
jgi:hypothetical protein